MGAGNGGRTMLFRCLPIPAAPLLPHSVPQRKLPPSSLSASVPCCSSRSGSPLYPMIKTRTRGDAWAWRRKDSWMRSGRVPGRYRFSPSSPSSGTTGTALLECLLNARGYLPGQRGVAFPGEVDVVRQLNFWEPG